MTTRFLPVPGGGPIRLAAPASASYPHVLALAGAVAALVPPSTNLSELIDRPGGLATTDAQVDAAFLAVFGRAPDREDGRDSDAIAAAIVLVSYWRGEFEVPPAAGPSESIEVGGKACRSCGHVRHLCGCIAFDHPRPDYSTGLKPKDGT